LHTGSDKRVILQKCHWVKSIHVDHGVGGLSFKCGTTMANNSYEHLVCGDLPLDMRLDLIATISGSDEYMNSTIGHLCKDSFIYTLDTCHRPNYELSEHAD